jgi:hypothetical protein
MAALDRAMPLIEILEADDLVAAAVENDVLCFLRQFLEGRLDVEVIWK